MKSLQKIFVEEIGLEEKHYAQFLECSRVVAYQKKDFILNEGSICSFIGFIEKGIVRSYLQKEDKEYNNDFCFESSFVTAYRSFLTQTPAFSTIQALAPVSIRLISFNQLHALQNSSDAWYKFGKYIGDELFIKKCKRETSFLKETASERYENLIATYPKIEQEIPQYQIASYLRIEPESLSRLKTLTYINS